MRPEGEPGISGGFYILKYQVSISPQFRVRALLLVMLLNNWGGGASIQFQRRAACLRGMGGSSVSHASIVCTSNGFNSNSDQVNSFMWLFL